MAEIVTGTPAVVGFTNDRDGRNRNRGISDKDQMFASNIDAGERTRDVLHAIGDAAVAVEKNGAANSLATEKIGAANALAIEKIGAAAVLTAEKIGTAAVLATETQSHALALQMCDLKATLAKELADCCCEVRRDVADVKATVLSVDANRIRDDLAESRAELLALRYAGNGNGNGNGNSVRS